MKDNRNVSRDTFAHRLVTFVRVVLTWPGRIVRASVTVVAWIGAWEIGGTALRHQPTDKTVLAIGIILFLFGTAFAWPDMVVRTFSVLANGYDAVRARKPSPPTGTP